MKKNRSKKGFTLVEMLVVIAIVAILSAIAIPVFSALLERTRSTVDLANARSASSLAYSEYMLYHANGDGTAGEKITYTFGTDNNGNLLILTHKGQDSEGFEDKQDNSEGTAIKGKSSAVGDKELTVEIEDGRIVSNSWIAVLNAA